MTSAIRAARPAILGLAVALGACLPAAAAAQNPSTVSAVPVPPEQIDAAVAQVDGIAADVMGETGIPGMAIAIVHGDRVVYATGFGVRRVGSPEPVDADTVFQLASVSKPVGATVISRLVGQRKLRWTDPIRRHLPWFALANRFASRNVTLADMYAHRSGLPDHAGDLLEDLGFRRRQVLRRLRFMPLAPFRANYAYTNFGLTAAGEAAARSQRKSWARLSRDLLYRPLGMSSTSSLFSDFERRPNRAHGHVRVGDRWLARFVRRPDAQSPAGGVSSSVNDMAKWLRLMLADGAFDGRRIVAPAALAEMLTPVNPLARVPAPNARPSLTALGIDTSVDPTGRVKFEHSGAFALGAGTTASWIPDLSLGIVTLTNAAPVGAAETVNSTFLELATQGRSQIDWLAGYGPIFEAMLANPSRLAGRERPARPRPARPRRAYVGTYARNPYYGSLRVVARGRRLVMVLGPRKRRQRFPLRLWNGDTFSIDPRGESAAGISAVRFHGGTRRAARAVTVEFLDGEGLGTFARRR
ncbi:MAG: serine hydrolase [Solirubrobacterales bacterium]|nr:serine hydrolase [Solirubrobacterales bacterium]